MLPVRKVQTHVKRRNDLCGTLKTVHVERAR